MKSFNNFYLLCVLLICSTTHIKATTLEVGYGFTYTTIQDAVNAAAISGDTLDLASATFTGAGNKNITTSKTFTIKAFTPRTVDLQNDGFFIAVTGGGSVTFSNFFIMNSNQTAIIAGLNCGLSLENGMTFTNNVGGAIQYHNFGGSNSLNIQSCTFSNNGAISGGAIDFSGSGIISESNFSNNQTSAIISQQGSLQVTGCNFLNNSNAIGSGGGAAYTTVNSNLAFTNCSFSGNTAVNGGAIDIPTTSTLSITSCTLIVMLHRIVAVLYILKQVPA